MSISEQTNDSFNIVGLKHPFKWVIIGPTCCGKTTLIKQILSNSSLDFDHLYINVNDIDKYTYDKLSGKFPKITYGFELKNMDKEMRNLVILEDETFSNIKEKGETIEQYLNQGVNKNISYIITVNCLRYIPKMTRLQFDYISFFRSKYTESEILSLKDILNSPNNTISHIQNMFDELYKSSTCSYSWILVDILNQQITIKKTPIDPELEERKKRISDLFQEMFDK